MGKEVEREVVEVREEVVVERAEVSEAVDVEEEDVRARRRREMGIFAVFVCLFVVMEERWW